jgi:hypothetical protein
VLLTIRTYHPRHKKEEEELRKKNDSWTTMYYFWEKIILYIISEICINKNIIFEKIEIIGNVPNRPRHEARFGILL